MVVFACDHIGHLLMEGLVVLACGAWQLTMEGLWRLGLENGGKHPCLGMEL